MKLILKEYLASLKERGDLDKAVLPNLLSESGLQVLNIPMIGTRQNGVDVSAVGALKNTDDQPYLYLFCIKAGNVSRRDWDADPQSVRPELNEIKDTYIRCNIAKEFADLPIKICLCCGGELEETVSMNWAGYTADNTTDKISYELWNGDRLSALMMRSLLARELLDEQPRSHFQKAVAMVNEPDACYEYTSLFLRSILIDKPKTEKERLLKLRQAYICLHAISAWAIDIENLESIYKNTELGLLLCWHVVGPCLGVDKKINTHQRALLRTLDQFLKLYLLISERYLAKTAFKYCTVLHALSSSVRSRESVDVNLQMYELLGRLAIRGIWTNFLGTDTSDENADFLKFMQDSTKQILDTLVAVINSNPTLNSPMRDDHMIEIALVLYLAQASGEVHRFLPWLKSIADLTTFSLLTNSQYPTCMRDYDDLLSHPLSDDQGYRDEACAGSVLYPFLFLWLQTAEEEKVTIEFVERLELKIPNCTHQAWTPDEDTDGLIWQGDNDHGVCITELSPSLGADKITDHLNEALKTCTDINQIGALSRNLYPLFLMACRHYRIPVPPQFWFVGENVEKDVDPPN